MKFSFAYVKKNPVMFGIIIIVFGLIFWLMLGGGKASGGASGGTTVVNQGPSDAEIAAGTAVTIAQLQAGAASQQGQLQLAAIQEQGNLALAIAGLDAQYKALELASGERIADKSITADLSALQLQASAQLAMNADNNQFMVDYARVAADTATEQIRISAALQSEMSANQLDAYKFGALTSVIPSLKKKDRDEALAGIGGYQIQRSSGGGGFLGGILKAVSPIAGALT